MVKDYSKLSSRFCWVSFDIEKLTRIHREVFAPVSFAANKGEFSFIWVQFHFIHQHP